MLISVSILLLVVALGGLVARSVNSRRQPVIVAAALAPWLMAAALPAAVLAAVAGAWIPCTAAVVVLGAAVATQWPLYRARWRRRPPATGPGLRVMQANILVGGADPEALAASVDRLGIEILTVCEVTPEGLERIMASRLPQLLPYHYCSTGEVGDGTGIWSRYPLSDTRRHDGFVTELLSASVDLPDGGSVLVYAVHPVPPWPRDPADWLREMELLRQMLAKVPADAGPVVVAGDFNATADHRPYRALLEADYRDVAISTGSGILPTYAADRWYPPVIAIDHILLRDADPHEVHTVSLPGSDHRGIWAAITLREKS
ncbi:endonuclease/exonuclease/phosphatase family protein [Nocardia miyunensis]|uniref:endonuclease/exonuclease/phosphatase family protein n=1 Tax=Nocardia miyunensis TaxID=282684 RepID=UPI000AFE64E5|nr:endonuclease/exonuclease/phosphatase family protein [Nocardia miyunensis]